MFGCKCSMFLTSRTYSKQSADHSTLVIDVLGTLTGLFSIPYPFAFRLCIFDQPSPHLSLHSVVNVDPQE